jgi:adenylate kinase
MSRVVCIVGISGVGKTTLINHLNESVDFQHLSAGQIIKKQRESEIGKAQEHDRLREQNIDENQRLLIDGLYPSGQAAF